MIKVLTFALLFILFSCQDTKINGLHVIELRTPAGQKIESRVAITPKEQEQGLSGIADSDFKDNEGMLFYYLNDDEKNFWMPDTYFDLDLFYMDKDLKILDIVRKLPHHVGRANPESIPRARPVWCRHTLEMKSSSPLAQTLKIGDQLTWTGKLSPAEAEAILRKSL